jgi:hypothetical protein
MANSELPSFSASIISQYTVKGLTGSRPTPFYHDFRLSDTGSGSSSLLKVIII